MNRERGSSKKRWVALHPSLPAKGSALRQQLAQMRREEQESESVSGGDEQQDSSMKESEVRNEGYK